MMQSIEEMMHNQASGGGDQRGPVRLRNRAETLRDRRRDGQGTAVDIAGQGNKR